MGEKSILIVCVGNRYLENDDLGPRVYDSLARREIPEDVSLVDGGLKGLDLLGIVERARRVVFVDALQGFAPSGRPVILERAAALEERPASYGHKDGLAYLLSMLPAVCESGLPEIALVGAAPPIEPAGIEEIADMAMSTAMGERHGRKRNKATHAVQPGTP